MTHDAAVCLFTARPDFDVEQEHRFVEALSAMSYDNPVHRLYSTPKGCSVG